MIYNVYSLFDQKANVFSQPFFCVNHSVALRSFGQAATDSSTQISRTPSDFSLFHIGAFDDSDATFINQNPTVNLGSATQFQE